MEISVYYMEQVAGSINLIIEIFFKTKLAVLAIQLLSEVAGSINTTQ